MDGFLTRQSIKQGLSYYPSQPGIFPEKFYMFKKMFEKALKIEKKVDNGLNFGQTILGPAYINLIFNAPNVANLGF